MRKSELDKKLYEMADRIFVNIEGRGDLETHHCGDHDFFEVAVWELMVDIRDAGTWAEKEEMHE